jgi:outer membrane murein-binding lipoprotein Lpp
VIDLPNLSSLSHDEKDALIRALWAQVQALTAQVQTLTARVADLEVKLGGVLRDNQPEKNRQSR